MSEIKNEDSFGVRYYEYAQPFYGSFNGMRYRIERNPMDFVALKPADKKGEAVFKATIWPEPFCFEKTGDDIKLVKEFPFTGEGKEEMTKWLNDMYKEKQEYWNSCI